MSRGGSAVTRGDDTSYCEAAECEEETRDGRRYCEFHEKRHQRGQRMVDIPGFATVRPQDVSPQERAIDAMAEYMDADSEDDAEYKRLEERLLRALDVWQASRGWVAPSKLEAHMRARGWLPPGVGRGVPMRARKRNPDAVRVLQMEFRFARLWTMKKGEA